MIVIVAPAGYFPHAKGNGTQNRPLDPVRAVAAAVSQEPPSVTVTDAPGMTRVTPLATQNIRPHTTAVGSGWTFCVIPERLAATA